MDSLQLREENILADLYDCCTDWMDSSFGSVLFFPQTS